MHVSPSCYIVLTVFFLYLVTDDDVRNIETCLEIKKCRNLRKDNDYAVSFEFEHSVRIAYIVRF